MGTPLADLRTGPEFDSWVRAQPSELLVQHGAALLFDYPHFFHRLPVERRDAIRGTLEKEQYAALRAWDQDGRPAERVAELWRKEQRLHASIDVAPEHYAALKRSAEAGRLADARDRGIRVRTVRQDEDIFSGERTFAILRSRTVLRVRHRGARQQRPAGARTRGSRRRSVSRAFSRGGDSGDPDEPDLDHPRGAAR
jgi:hypothetical protein